MIPQFENLLASVFTGNQSAAEDIRQELNEFMHVAFDSNDILLSSKDACYSTM